MLDELRALNAHLKVIHGNRRLTKIDNFNGAQMLRLEANGGQKPAKASDPIVIHRRDEHALAGIDGTDEDVVLVWGSAHLPGLDEGLRARGFQPDSVAWYTVGRLPTLWAILPTALMNLLVNIRQLPTRLRMGYAHSKALWQAQQQQAREAEQQKEQGQAAPTTPTPALATAAGDEVPAADYAEGTSPR
jgi:hypothetical protein